MKINPFFHDRTISNPIVGITLTRDEEQDSARMALGMSNFSPETIQVIRRGLAREIIHLFEIEEWTIGEMDNARRGQLLQAVLAYHATYPMPFIAARESAS